MTPIIDAVIAERVRQDAQWGGAAHDDQHTTQDFAQFMYRRVTSLATAGIYEDSQTMIETLVEIAALAITAAERVQRKL